MRHQLDTLIIGFGQTAMPLAEGLAEKEQRVAIAERRQLGGSCVNFGCTPTKAVITSAHVAHTIRRAAEFGIQVPEPVIDFAAVLGRARQIVEASRNGLERRVREDGNPFLLRGHARLQGRSEQGFRIQVDDTEVVARQVVLDTGTRVAIPPITGLNEVDYLHSGNWLHRDVLPRRLLLLGGGYIGLEMGQFYRRMGSEVTIVEANEILGSEEPEIAKVLRQRLQEEGIRLHSGCRVECIENNDGQVKIKLEERQGSTIIEADAVFVATGRQPNTDDLGLDTVGVAVDEKGFIEVDDRLSTSVPGIWASGDIRGGPMFTHTAWDDHRVLLGECTGEQRRTQQRLVPSAIYTDPELGRVGLTEQQAREQGKAVKIAVYEMWKNGKAQATGETAGLVKLVLNQETDCILGASICSHSAAELVHVCVALMAAGAPGRVFRDAVAVHPTFSEALHSALRLASTA